MTWNKHDPVAMAQHIQKGGLPLSKSEQRLVNRALDPEPNQWLVYYLYDLNVLCWMTEGYKRK